MKLFLDTAIYEEVEQGVTWGVIDGVTTNPTLIAKAGKDHEEQVKRICQIIGNVSAEVVSEKKDDMIVEGRRIATWHKNVIVKVPLTPDGLAAGKVLAGEGTRINVTLCFSVNQALLAAAIGAYIVSPFAGRLDDINEDGMRVVADIVAAYRQQEIKTKVLAASIRNPMHVTQPSRFGTQPRRPRPSASGGAPRQAACLADPRSPRRRGRARTESARPRPTRPVPS